MRETKEVTITAEGRDKGKTFILTEMAAKQAEAWAMRAMGAMARSGTHLPDDMVKGGMAAFAMVGLKAFLAAPWSDVSPLLDELMACVQIKMPKVTRELVEEDVEEIATYIKLRDEVMALHVGFFPITSLLAAISVASLTGDTSTTSISGEPSEPSSQAA